MKTSTVSTSPLLFSNLQMSDNVKLDSFDTFDEDLQFVWVPGGATEPSNRPYVMLKDDCRPSATHSTAVSAQAGVVLSDWTPPSPLASNPTNGGTAEVMASEVTATSKETALIKTEPSTSVNGGYQCSNPLTIPTPEVVEVAAADHAPLPGNALFSTYGNYNPGCHSKQSNVSLGDSRSTSTVTGYFDQRYNLRNASCLAPPHNDSRLEFGHSANSSSCAGLRPRSVSFANGDVKSSKFGLPPKNVSCANENDTSSKLSGSKRKGAFPNGYYAPSRKLSNVDLETFSEEPSCGSPDLSSSDADSMASIFSLAPNTNDPEFCKLIARRYECYQRKMNKLIVMLVKKVKTLEQMK